MAAATAAAVAALVVRPAVTAAAAAGAGVMVVEEKEEASPRLAVRLLVLPVRATEAVPIIFRNPVRRTMSAGAAGAAGAAALGTRDEELEGSAGTHPPLCFCVGVVGYPGVLCKLVSERVGRSERARGGRFMRMHECTKPYKHARPGAHYHD